MHSSSLFLHKVLRAIACVKLAEWDHSGLGLLAMTSYFYRTRVRSLAMLVTNWVTDSRLTNLIDVTLACEDGHSKLVEVVTVADIDAEKRANTVWCRFES